MTTYFIAHHAPVSDWIILGREDEGGRVQYGVCRRGSYLTLLEDRARDGVRVWHDTIDAAHDQLNARLDPALNC